MPTRKIKDDPYVNLEFCRDPEHAPPTMMHYKDGTYEHECPSCGHKFHFNVHRPTLTAQSWFGTEQRSPALTPPAESWFNPRRADRIL
jgi:hypothetical protein